MTDRIFRAMMNKIPSGEYDANDLFSLYMIICPKSYIDMSKYKNKMRYFLFASMFDEKKYSFEYMFNGKVRYIGTNDLHILTVADK